MSIFLNVFINIFLYLQHNNLSKIALNIKIFSKFRAICILFAIGGIMLTILAFILTLLGSVNWLLIGLLQYDFVAGIFGYQGSVFSRLIYIIIGASSIILVWKLIKGKGSIPVITRRNKKDVAKQMTKLGQKMNIEASKEEQHSTPINQTDEHFGDSGERFSPPQQDQEEKHGLFDEEFKD